MSAGGKGLKKSFRVGVLVAALVAAVVAGMVAYAVHTESQQHDQPASRHTGVGMKLTTHGWSAWYNRMPGTKNPNLHVSGVCELPSGSRAARLEHPEGVVDDKGTLTLRLVADLPETGDDRSSEQRVTWEGAAAEGEIKTVRILVPGEDEPISVDVVIAE